MLRRKRKYIVLFTIIVFAWAVGIAGLILWQTGKSHTQAEDTNASYTTPSSSYSSTKEDHSQFGKLLK